MPVIDKKNHSKTSQYLISCHCPKCKKLGNAKLRTNGYDYRYIQIDHYLFRKGKKIYVCSCYIRKVQDNETIEKLKKELQN